MNIAPEFLLVGLLSPNSQNPSEPVILRGAERRFRRIHHPKYNSRPPGEGGLSQTVGEGQTKTLSHLPNPP